MDNNNIILCVQYTHILCINLCNRKTYPVCDVYLLLYNHSLTNKSPNCL